MTAALYSIETEQALLGSIIVDKSAFERAASVIESSQLYDPFHQRMFAAMDALAGQGSVIDPVTLGGALKGDPAFPEVGGYRYLAGLAQAAPAKPDVAAMARIVLDLALRREARQEVEGATAMIDDMATPLADGLASLAAIADRAEQMRSAKQIRSVGDMTRLVMTELSARADGKPSRSVPIGIDSMDRELGGFFGGDLILVAGRSGMGKSAFMGSVALNVAMRGFPVLIFSLEMTSEQWTQRTICDLDCHRNPDQEPLHYRLFRVGGFEGGPADRAAEAAYELAQLPMFIQDEDRLGVRQIVARARGFRARYGEDQLGAVFIDYLQIVDTSRSTEQSRERQVAEVARGCKSLAKTIGWPVIGGVQLLSKGEKTEKIARPNVSQVRESGNLEFEADVILMPYREGYALRRQGVPESGLGGAANSIEIIVGKNRPGRYVDFPLWCNIGANAIRDAAPPRRQPELTVIQGLLDYSQR